MTDNNTTKSSSRRTTQEQSDDGGSLYNSVKRDLKRLYRKFKRNIVIYTPILFLLFTGLFGFFEAINLDTTIIPDYIVPYSVYWFYGVYGGLIPAELLRRFITNDTDERLYRYNAKSSKLAKWSVPPQIIHKINFVTPDGDPLDWDDVDQIHTAKHGRAYLVSDFDPNSLRAEVTWLAGKNQLDLRAEKKQLDEAVTVTWKMAESAIKVLSQRENISREAALKEIMTNIENRESINLESETRQTDIETVLKNNDVLQQDIIQDMQDELRDNNE